MDGTFLDSESTDTTLAKDWSLPVLPEDNSLLPSSSQELADIFGTSDDEDDIDFPFSLSSNLHISKGYDDISLSAGDTKPFGSSLLSSDDSGLFLNNCQQSSANKEGNGVNGDLTEPENVGGPPVVQSIGAPEDNVCVEQDTDSKELESLSASENQGSNPESDAKGANRDDSSSGENISNMLGTLLEGASLSKETNGQSTLKTQQTEVNPFPVRKSARLRARFDVIDMSGGSSSECETKEDIEYPTSDPTPTATPEVVKEETKDESSNEPNQIAETEKLNPVASVGDDTPLAKLKEDVQDDSDQGEDSGEGDESEDPDKLYCICRQPHDDRFMICCDRCEDWFHGKCVGITVAQGKKMEREGKDYVCPVCLENESKMKEEKEINRFVRQQNREIVRDKFIKKKLAAQIANDAPQSTPKVAPQRRRTLSGSTPHYHIHTPTTPTESDSYGLAQLFIPDNAPKGEVSFSTDQGGVAKTEDVKVPSNELLLRKCMIFDCHNMTTPPSIYCSLQCIEKHVADSLKRLASRGISIQSNPSEFVRGSGGIGVIEKYTKKIKVGICAPSEKELIPWLQKNPSYQVLVHHKGGEAKAVKSKSSKLKHESRKHSESSSKYPKIALMDPESVRGNAKKALYQILWKRCEDAPDLSALEQAEVEKCAHDIEEKLFNLYRDISPKYKNKYRSLIFNLKDTKNQGLFRKVILKNITAKELVRMSTEKLASDDLAAWREHTLKKNLEMIRQREEEAGVLGEVIRKVTHKGEVEIDSSEIEDSITEKVITPESVDPEDDVPNSDNTNFLSKTDSLKSESKSTDISSKSGHRDGSILDLLTNSTSLHGSHVYDQYCDICTGKVKCQSTPPQNSPPQTSPPQTSPDSHMEEDSMTTRTIELPSPDSVERTASPPAPAVSSNKTVWRGFVDMLGLTKFATTARVVSGHSDDIVQAFPNTLHVLGRIAHAQVWDYVDKLRNSSSREVAVLQFEWLEEDKDAYVSMFNYLARKHRYGVITSCCQEIKDMYLIPLPGHKNVPHQLLPFDGPGLPVNRGDRLLGVIVRTKLKKHHHHLQETTSPITQIRAEVSLKRYHSSGRRDSEDPQKNKRIKFQADIGFGDHTPPSSSRHSDTVKNDPVEFDDDDDDESAPYSPSNLLEETLDSQSMTKSDEGKETNEGVRMSFYGEHRPLSSVASISNQTPASSLKVVSSDSSNTVQEINTATVAATLKATLNFPPTTDIKKILAQLSNDKLKELASAVSSLEKISDGNLSFDRFSVTPGKEVNANVLPTAVSSVSNEATIRTPSEPLASMAGTNTPQNVSQSDSAMSVDAAAVLANSQQAPSVQGYDGTTRNTDPPSQLGHSKEQQPATHYHTPGTQPHLPNTLGTQPHLPNTLGTQPHFSQTQGTQPHFSQTQGTQPHLPQTQPHLPQTQGVQPHLPQTQASQPAQAQDSHPHPVQYHSRPQHSGDNTDSFKNWDHRQDHPHPGFNSPSQVYNQHPQHPPNEREGFQQAPDVHHGPNDSNPNYPSQPMYSPTPPPLPTHSDPVYQHGQHSGHNWQDPRSTPTHQQPHWDRRDEQRDYAHEHVPYNEPQFESHGSNKEFHGPPSMGFRGDRGFQGRGLCRGRRGRWSGEGRPAEHRERYHDYHV